MKKKILFHDVIIFCVSILFMYTPSLIASKRFTLGNIVSFTDPYLIIQPTIMKVDLIICF